MKTKNSIFTSIIAIIIAVFMITGCKKRVEEAPIPTPTPFVSPTDSASQSTRAMDQTNVDNESNLAMDEANSALQQVSTTRGVQSTCGYKIDSSEMSTGKITLRYDTTLCNGKIRYGTIAIQLPYANGTITPWSTAGSIAILTFTNYKVVYPNNNNASIEFNGIHKITNVNAGGWLECILGTPIIHIVRSHQNISFNGGTPIEWNSALKTTYTYTGTYPSGVLKATVLADSLPGTDKILMWGINPMGDHFVIKMPTDYTYDLINPLNNNTCIFKPLAGVVEYHGITYIITITYGVDGSGIPVYFPNCPTGYKIEWHDNAGNYIWGVIPYPI